MIFPGFPGVLSFFEVFQIEWDPCLYTEILAPTEAVGNSSQLQRNAKFFMCTLGPTYSKFAYDEHPVIMNTACNEQILTN